MSGPAIAARQATAADARAIAEVHVEGWRWAYRGVLSDELLDGLSVERREAMWRDALAPPDAEARVWLVERDGRAIGLAATAPVRGGRSSLLTAEVTAIYVAQHAAGTGAGRELLLYATDDLRRRGFRRALLWVFAANARARRFYEIAGWRPDGATRLHRRGDAEMHELRYALAIEGAAPVVPARSARLVLRPWQDEDLASSAALNADPRVMKFFPSVASRAASDATAERIRRHFVEHGFGLWAAELPGVAGFVGFVGLAHVPFAAPFTPAVEIGWRLAVEHWGLGYATEGARAALAAGFGRLGLDEIVAMTVPANTRSRNVMQKLGMHRSPADDFDHPRIAAGHPFQRHVLYRLSRTAWEHHVAVR